jgi:ribosomal protein L12E/L44/L45/RPP1/RPP2
MKEVICPHTILVSLAVVHLTMLRRAIRCLAPAGPAWTTFKSLVDQGAIPDVDAGKAEAVFASLSSDQLKQLTDAAASVPAATAVAASPATAVAASPATAVPVVTATPTKRRGRPAGTTKKSNKPNNTPKGRRGRPSLKKVARSSAINLGTGLRRDLRMMLAAEKVHLRNGGATQATFAALSKSERDALAKEARKVFTTRQMARVAKFPANTALPEVARMLTLLYNVEKGGKVPYEDLSQKQRTLLRGLAYALKNTPARVTLEQVGYVLQHADKMRAGRVDTALRTVMRFMGQDKQQ